MNKYTFEELDAMTTTELREVKASRVARLSMLRAERLELLQNILSLQHLIEQAEIEAGEPALEFSGVGIEP